MTSPLHKPAAQVSARFRGPMRPLCVALSLCASCAHFSEHVGHVDMRPFAIDVPEGTRVEVHDFEQYARDLILPDGGRISLLEDSQGRSGGIPWKPSGPEVVVNACVGRHIDPTSILFVRNEEVDDAYCVVAVTPAPGQSARGLFDRVRVPAWCCRAP